MNRETAELLARVYAPAVHSRAELMADGWTAGGITAAVRSGRLVRLRRGHYSLPGVNAEVAEAVRIGGRVTCLTLMQMLGVFVLRTTGIHLHLPPHMSRLRAGRTEAPVRHWSRRPPQASPRHVVALADAVRQSVLCQEPRAAIATLDSLVHQGLMSLRELEQIFAELPARLRTLLKLVDPSAESGPETFMRLILRTLGVRYQTQVSIPGVGRVDFVVEGWLIIECDSREYHQGWEKQLEDRRRDLAAARLGYTTIRPVASDILFDAAGMRRMLAEILAAFDHRGGQRHRA